VQRDFSFPSNNVTVACSMNTKTGFCTWSAVCRIVKTLGRYGRRDSYSVVPSVLSATGNSQRKDLFHEKGKNHNLRCGHEITIIVKGFVAAFFYFYFLCCSLFFLLLRIRALAGIRTEFTSP